MPILSQRSQTIGESLISKMSTLGDQYGAINMSSGYPDFPPPLPMRQRLAEVALVGPHQYSDDNGDLALRQALASCRQQFSGEVWDAEKEILITCGGTEALVVALMGVVNPGDKVILFSPFYDAYGADTRLCGAEPIYVSLHEPDYTFDPEELERAFQQHPKAILFCNPANPCGRVFSKDELLVIAALAQKYDTFVLVDEVYSHIVYAPNVYTYFSSLPHMKERTICCGSFSKTYSVTGWRLGYLLATPDITRALYKVHECLSLSAPSPLQEAAIAGLKLAPSYYQALTAMYTKKRDYVAQCLDQSGIAHNLPQGAFYMFIDIRPFGLDDVTFCEKVIKELRVSLVPGSCFFVQPVHHLARLQFAIRDETLQEAMQRLKALEAWKK